MKITKSHKKEKCPACGSKDLHTQNLDQFCLDCDWTNSALLVQLGVMDHPITANNHPFMSFNDLPDADENHAATYQEIKLAN